MGVQQVITDDLTGERLSDDTKPTAVTFNGKKFETYLSAESVETLEALFAGEAAILADRKPAAAKKTTANRNADSDIQGARAWAIESGFKYKGADGKERTLGNRGQVPKVVMDAWADAGKPDVAA